MKADERKEIETNSLILTWQRLKSKVTGRLLYYVVGSIALVLAIVLTWRYFANMSKRERDAVVKDFETADTAEKLKAGMEEHRGSLWGDLFKINLARHLLKSEGIPRLGTDRIEVRNQAASAIEQARAYYLELTDSLKQYKQTAMIQEAWLSAGEAEESLVGLPKTEGSSDYRGNVDKAIEYFKNAAAIFPETEFSQKYAKRAEELQANKDKFVADQTAYYKIPEKPKLPEFPPVDPKLTPGLPKLPIFPGIPGLDPKDLPDVPKTPLPGQTPKGPDSPPKANSKDPKAGEPKAVDPKAGGPKAVDPKAGGPKAVDPKTTEPPKPADKAKN